MKKSVSDTYPALGSKVATPEGTAIIENINPVKKEISLRYPTDGKEILISLQDFKSMFVKK